MSEHFLKLDTNNYDTEFDYLLNDDIYNFEDYKNFYQEGKLTSEGWEKVREHYGLL